METENRLISDDGELALMLHDERAPCGRLIAIILATWQVRAFGDDDAIDAYAMKAFDDERDAFVWFSEVSLIRPWETRH